jgi:hypothetical protein
MRKGKEQSEGGDKRGGEDAVKKKKQKRARRKEGRKTVTYTYQRVARSGPFGTYQKEGNIGGWSKHR